MSDGYACLRMEQEMYAARDKKDTQNFLNDIKNLSKKLSIIETTTKRETPEAMNFYKLILMERIANKTGAYC